MQGPLSWNNPEEAIDKLYRMLDCYFRLFQEASPERWDMGKKGVFPRNIGVAGLIQLLADLIQHHQNTTDEDPRYKEPEEIVEDFKATLEPLLKYFRESELQDLQTRFRTQFGTQGPKEFQRKAPIPYSRRK